MIIMAIFICLTLTFGASDSYSESTEHVTRTRAEVDALIDELGKTSPDWWDSVPLTYPETLDLNWPMKAPAPWNNQKNVGQYIWDIINPNPGRWQEGTKLVHHLLIRHQDDPKKTKRAMETLGRMYHDLLEDWARAAFWWRKAGGNATLGLADCYWKLGNKEMAMEMLSRMRGDYTRHGSVIKLWGDIGELDRAIRLAENKARYHMADTAYLAAGDACRTAGKYNLAIKYYEKVLTVPSEGDKKAFTDKNKERARNSIEAIKLFDNLDLSRISDGVYRSSSMGYNAEIFIEVEVKDGKIESVRVTRHREKQFYSAIKDTTRQIIDKQSVKDIDATTSATITSDAIINATARALASGMK